MSQCVRMTTQGAIVIGIAPAAAFYRSLEDHGLKENWFAFPGTVIDSQEHRAHHVADQLILCDPPFIAMLHPLAPGHEVFALDRGLASEDVAIAHLNGKAYALKMKDTACLPRPVSMGELPGGHCQ